jgi:hypothetical protein
MSWFYFNLLVLSLLALDLFVLNRRDHVIGVREALGWSAFWIAVSLTFNFYLYLMRGEQAAVEFLTAYLLEKSLSVDNLFVYSAVQLFQSPARVSAQSAVLGHYRGFGAACHIHLGGGDAYQQVCVDNLHPRRFSGVHGHSAFSGWRRARNSPRGQLRRPVGEPVLARHARVCGREVFRSS